MRGKSHSDGLAGEIGQLLFHLGYVPMTDDSVRPKTFSGFAKTCVELGSSPRARNA